LFEAGCKGKKTFNNCPSVKFNDGTSFPMQAGHPCIGCSEPDFWDTMTPFYQKTS
jgi:[NiFe] hydrogenase small subunit